MRKFIVSVIALAVLGLSAPLAMSTSADAGHHYRGHKKVVIIKKHRDRGHHYGWYKRNHHPHRGAAVVVR
ncbi:MAG: hypothetical protein K2Y27_05705 [Xanthobacteraceae bacterium]|nr:hypothetical protein [Xanthobacteraceae bacterium]